MFKYCGWRVQKLFTTIKTCVQKQQVVYKNFMFEKLLAFYTNFNHQLINNCLLKYLSVNLKLVALSTTTINTTNDIK
jgi:hypothetical protein